MTDEKSNFSGLDKEALEWLTASATDERSRQRFGAWVMRSPAHLLAFLEQKALTTELSGLDPERSLNLASLLERARENTKVVRWPGRMDDNERVAGTPAALEATTGHARHAYWKWLAAGIAALAVTATTFYSGVLNKSRSEIYSTGTGQQRRIVLTDSSVIDLNTESSVRIHYSSTAREVYLLDGEALFNVKHDITRPFRVHTNGTLIEDLATQFSVHLRADATTVSVLDGAVQVSTDERGGTASTVKSAGTSDVIVTTAEFEPLRKPARVPAGEQARIVAEGTLMQVRPLDVIQATAWRHGRLVFSDATLDDIVSEFNRYNIRKIRIHGDELKERRYSGVFDARDPESFIQFLSEDQNIQIENDPEGLVLSKH